MLQTAKFINGWRNRFQKDNLELKETEEEIEEMEQDLIKMETEIGREAAERMGRIDHY